MSPARDSDPLHSERDAALARYYDLEHDALVADAALYVELARRAGGPVLELGCGTGRILAALVRGGREVTGVDHAPAMLARAHARLLACDVSTARWQLVAQDLRTLQVAQGFGLVLAPLDLLGYFPDRESQLAVLAGARRHLAPGGQLVVDVAFPPAALLGQPEGVLVHQWTHPDQDGATVTKWWVREVDPVAQVQHLTAFYDVLQPDGRLRRWVDMLALRYYQRFELELLLTCAGFAVEGVYGGYALEELQPDSQRLLVLARPNNPVMND